MRAAGRQGVIDAEAGDRAAERDRRQLRHHQRHQAMAQGGVDEILVGGHAHHDGGRRLVHVQHAGERGRVKARPRRLAPGPRGGPGRGRRFTEPNRSRARLVSRHRCPGWQGGVGLAEATIAAWCSAATTGGNGTACEAAPGTAGRTACDPPWRPSTTHPSAVTGSGPALRMTAPGPAGEAQIREGYGPTSGELLALGVSSCGNHLGAAGLLGLVADDPRAALADLFGSHRQACCVLVVLPPVRMSRNSRRHGEVWLAREGLVQRDVRQRPVTGPPGGEGEQRGLRGQPRADRSGRRCRRQRQVLAVSYLSR